MIIRGILTQLTAYRNNGKLKPLNSSSNHREPRAAVKQSCISFSYTYDFMGVMLFFIEEFTLFRFVLLCSGPE